MSPTDTELMERFGAGDDGAFHELMRRHHQGLLNFFWRRSFDRQLAEDCVQEVALRLIRHRGRWRPDAKVTTYVYRIAENLWIDQYRSRKAAPDVASLSTPVSQDGGELVEAVPGRSPDPGQRAVDQELGQRIRAALEQLTPDQRQIFDLGEVQGMRYADIGELLGIPVGTVKSRMHAAVTRLRKLLEAEVRGD